MLLNYVTNLDDVAVGQSQLDTITYRTFQYDDECDAETATDGTEIGDENHVRR